ncbi:hypothetical protein FH968_01915 [Buttiauxella sp. B2]|uniref:baseplate hub protein n=1 Tax=Buttiauxella sp. B2 TaxID=2587812 RepID=UPI00111DE89D|nr:hypothetical protein [Buttiauxella sp. B2]TNV22825.1 hypothetical protein FH968_01915 [Buttiauxella sp. B2]
MSKFFGRSFLLTITTTSGEVLTYAPPMEVRYVVDNFPQHTNATAKISIFGISPKARELIQTRNDMGNNYGHVELVAGYEENAGMIFTGRINSVQVSKDGVSTCISLYCNSASEQWSALSFQAWGENTPYKDVIRDLAAGFGAPVEFIGDFSDLPVLLIGYNGGGKLCRELLDQIKNFFHFSWLHTPTKTVISREGAARDWVEHEISALNGMEGIPRWYASSMEVDIKLNHEIQPGDVVNVTSSFWTLSFSGAYFTDLQDLSDKQRKTGKFTVLRTLHEGALWGNNWKTTVICQWRQEISG